MTRAGSAKGRSPCGKGRGRGVVRFDEAPGGRGEGGGG